MHEKDVYKMYKGDPEEEELGGEEDIIAYWKWLYFKNRWNKITPFDEGGKIGRRVMHCASSNIGKNYIQQNGSRDGRYHPNGNTQWQGC